MNMRETFAQAESHTSRADPRATQSSLSSVLRWVCAWLATVVRTCAAHWAAAAAYEQLSGLSNAELNRRGLSRDTLARDLSEGAHQQASGRERL